MNHGDIIWSQKAHSSSNTLQHLGYFLYEFISARITLLAFIGLFNFAAFNFEFYGQVLATGIAVFLYYIISDSFKVFWTGLNLKYSITNKGVLYQWGVIKDKELFIPFDEITGISSVNMEGEKRSALIFENTEKIKNGDYGFSNEIYFTQLTFENVVEIDSVIDRINKLKLLPVTSFKESSNVEWRDRVPHSNLYLKFLQLLGFGLIYLATAISLHLIDANLLTPVYVSDVVVHQEAFRSQHGHPSSRLITKEGYRIKLKGPNIYKDKEVEFMASPLFNHVVQFLSFNSVFYESLESSYTGFNKIFKIVSVIICLFSGVYIFYKRGFVPIEDLSIFIALPIIVLTIAFYFYH